ncbi:MAG TPA: hypothetical protein DDZ65_00235 [Firmicutes bacterium]|nr:hypothetical protein [Bacillota bacterium]
MNNVVGVIQALLFTNLMLFAMFSILSFLINTFGRLRARSKASTPLFEWRPTGREWRTYLKGKSRSYLLSFLLFLAIFVVLSALFGGKEGSIWSSLTMVASLIPGVVFYVLAVILSPNKYTIYPEGITSFGWLYYNTSRKGEVITEAKVGFQPWTKFSGYQWDGDILLLKTQFAFTEIVAGQHKGRVRDLLRECLKEASKSKQRSNKQQKIESDQVNSDTGNSDQKS